MDFRSWLKTRLTRWRLALLVFIVIYASLLLLNLGYMTIQWDEMPHLYGSLLLAQGKPQMYVSTYGYYPPLYDLVTTGFFAIFGAGAFSGRLAAVAFSLLSIWIVFEFANRTYGPKAALTAAILLGVMPGFFWLSRAAMLETALIFFFSVSLFFFFNWMHFNQNKALILCGVAVGVGFLAKYQIVVAGLVMIVSLLLLYRKKLRVKFSKFMLLPLIAVLVIVPWILVLSQVNGLDKLGQLLYVIQEGGQDRAVYSTRFPIPIFYLIEVVWPYTEVHPISLLVYALGLMGLGLWAYRRKPEDKFFLIWFIVVYVFFTLIPNRQWRYVTPLFPVLAIAAASFVWFAYGKARDKWNTVHISVSRKRAVQIAAAALIAFLAVSVAYSSVDAYQMVARDQIHIPTQEATDYAANRMQQSDSIMVLCAFNFFNKDMVKFYLEANASRHNEVLQYPELPIDAFKPNFNATELVWQCQQNNVKYVFLYEYGGDIKYFDSDLTAMDVYLALIQTGNFTEVNTVGTSPRTITIFAFT